MGRDILGGSDAGSRAAAVLLQVERLRRRAGALTRNQADADDLVQDTLERAVRALPRLRPTSNLAAWLNTLMSHRFIDVWRTGGRMGPLECADHVAAPEPEAPEPWEELTEAQLKAGIDELPVPAADVIRLRYYRKMSYPEIARLLGTTCDTVGTRLFRARVRLREILTAKYLQPPPAAITPISRRPARTRRRLPAQEQRPRARAAQAGS